MAESNKWTIRRVINPTSEELDSMAAVANEAYQGDAFTRASIGDSWDNNIIFQRGVVGAQQVAGENWIALDGDKIVAVAGWFPPGRVLLDSPEQAAAGWNNFVTKLTPELGEWWMKYFLPAYDQATEAALGKGTKKDIWHIQMLVTLPEYRGRGIASALVKLKEKEIAAEGGAMCLESEVHKNTEMYKSWGWETRGPKTTFESPHGAFDMWVLYKKPSM